MSFAEDIKRIRRKVFLTQEDFAKEIGVSFATVNRWETGKAKPTLKTMKLMEKAFLDGKMGIFMKER